jgi:hypothetical protein
VGNSTGFILAWLLCCLSMTPATEAASPGNAGGLFVVEDALGQFDALKHHPEALAWRNPEAQGAVDPSIYDHYQGVLRNPNTGTPVFYVTQLDDDDGGTAGGYLHVVSFGSRGTDGERLRSNLQQVGNDTEEAYPPSNDTWIRRIRFDGTVEFDGDLLPVYKHAGGMALVDDVLFVPVDQSTDADAPTGQLLLFDVAADATDPQPLHALPLEHGIDNVAVTRLDGGTYRIWTNGNGGEDIHVYVTDHRNLRDSALGLNLTQTWDDATGLVGASWPTGTGAHQSSTFLRETDDTLYLIGMRHPGGSPFSGSDYADLYRVAETDLGELILFHQQTRQFNCVYDGGGGPVDMRVCNMSAATSTYVTPSGELILYAAPHDDEDGFDPDIVRMGEFRHRDVNRESSPLRAPTSEANGPYSVDEGNTVELHGSGAPPADRPWIELYDDTNFADRSIVVDYDDRGLLELDNFNHLDGFNDKTSSVRWRSPVGLNIVLYDDDHFRDRHIVLRGTGQTQAISNLKNQPVLTGLVEHYDPFKGNGEALDFNDKTSSLLWTGAVPSYGSPVLEWDLDGDGVFGETGPAAAYGDEVGATAAFDAAALDGPTTIEVRLRVSISGVAGFGVDTAVIQVDNVPPTAAIDSLDGGLPGVALVGLPVNLAGSYLDIPADTHTAEVDWGDGDTTPGTVDATIWTVAASHVYAVGGDFDVQLTVTDDDDGAGSASAPLTVYGAAGAGATVLERIDALLGLPLSHDDRAALQDARDLLDGNHGGRAHNGALDKLDADDLVAALVKIEACIEALDGVSGVDVADLKLLLALAAQSVGQTARDDAAAAIGPAPTPYQLNLLAEVDAWLADGAAKLDLADYAAAVHSFRFATARALELLSG